MRCFSSARVCGPLAKPAGSHARSCTTSRQHDLKPGSSHVEAGAASRRLSAPDAKWARALQLNSVRRQERAFRQGHRSYVTFAHTLPRSNLRLDDEHALKPSDTQKGVRGDSQEERLDEEVGEEEDKAEDIEQSRPQMNIDRSKPFPAIRKTIAKRPNITPEVLALLSELSNESELQYGPDTPEFYSEAAELARARARNRIIGPFPEFRSSRGPEQDWQLRQAQLVFLKAQIHRVRVFREYAMAMYSKGQSPNFLMEYIGSIQSTHDGADLTGSHRPGESWWRHRSTSQDPLLQLNMEMKDFALWVAHTEQERTARSKVKQKFSRMLKPLRSGFNTIVYGSESTDLGTSTSDIDIGFFSRSASGQVEREETSGVEQIGSSVPESLEGFPEKRLIEVLEGNPDIDTIHTGGISGHRRVQARHMPSGLNIQFIEAGKSSDPGRRLVTKQLKQYPFIVSVYHVLKATLESRGLLTPATGGLGSYALFNMILASVKARETMHSAFHRPQTWRHAFSSFSASPSVKIRRTHIMAAKINPTAFFPSLWPQFSKINYEMTPAMALLDFLKFWADFDTYGKGIDASTGLLFRKARKGTHTTRMPGLGVTLIDEVPDLRPTEVGMKYDQQRDLVQRNIHVDFALCLQDAADPTNDLGAKVVAWKDVQATFQDIYSSLMSRIAAGEAPRDRAFSTARNVHDNTAWYVEALNIHRMLRDDFRATIDRNANAEARGFDHATGITPGRLFDSQEIERRRQVAAATDDDEPLRVLTSDAIAPAPASSSSSRVPILRSLMGRWDVGIEAPRLAAENYEARLRGAEEAATSSRYDWGARQDEEESKQQQLHDVLKGPRIRISRRVKGENGGEKLFSFTKGDEEESKQQQLHDVLKGPGIRIPRRTKGENGGEGLFSFTKRMRGGEKSFSFAKTEHGGQKLFRFGKGKDGGGGGSTGSAT